MQPKMKSKIKLAVVLILIVLVACGGLFGMHFGKYGKYAFNTFAETLNYGTDLKGGLSIEYAATDISTVDFEEQMDKAYEHIGNLFGDPKFGELAIIREENRIAVEFPKETAEAWGDVITPAASSFSLGNAYGGFLFECKLEPTPEGGLLFEYLSEDTTEADFEYKMNSTVETLNARITESGLMGISVVRKGTDRIVVEMSGDSDKALSGLTEIGRFELREPDGNVFITDREIYEVKEVIDEQTQLRELEFTLHKSDREYYSHMTEQLAGQSIGVYIDDVEISSILVGEPVKNGVGHITFETGYTTYEEQAAGVKNARLQILSGPLSVELTKVESRTISASLGEDAGKMLAIGGLVALLLIFVFFVVVYRVPGVAASISLIVYTLIVFVMLCELPNVQFTLPTIAGLLLGFMLVVDVHVVLFERIQEELKSGYSPENAIKFGQKKALSAILFSSLCIGLFAGMLLMSNTDAVKNFAVGLLICACTSFFVVAVVTRFLLRNFMNMGLSDSKFYLRKAYKDRQASPAKSRRYVVGASVIVICVAIILQIAGMGLNLGTDFIGGTMWQYAVGEDYEVKDVEAALNQSGVGNYQIVKTTPAEQEIAEDEAELTASESEGSTSKDGMTDLQIRIALSEAELTSAQGEFESAMRSKYAGIQLVSSAAISASMQNSRAIMTIRAVLVAIALVIVYTVLRTRCIADGSVMISALLHNALIVCAFAVFFRWIFQVNISFVATILAVIGYSIINSAILLHRIRETLRTPEFMQLTREEAADVARKALHCRTMNTAIPVAIMLVCLFIFGVGAVRAFVLPLIIGMLVSAYWTEVVIAPHWAKQDYFYTKSPKDRIQR